MHTLRLLERLLAVDHAALSIMRDLGLWDVVYSASFFVFANDQVRSLDVAGNAGIIVGYPVLLSASGIYPHQFLIDSIHHAVVELWQCTPLT